MEEILPFIITIMIALVLFFGIFKTIMNSFKPQPRHDKIDSHMERKEQKWLMRDVRQRQKQLLRDQKQKIRDMQRR